MLRKDGKPRKVRKDRGTYRPTFGEKKVIEAITKARGLISVAADILGCAPRTVHKYIKEYPNISEAKYAATELNLDKAENKLMDAIDAGQPWAICFFLKCQGKDRGYIEKAQYEHVGSPPAFQFSFVAATPPDKGE